MCVWCVCVCVCVCVCEMVGGSSQPRPITTQVNMVMLCSAHQQQDNK